MTTRLPVSPAPGPLEAFAQHFDSVFSQRSQRQAFRDYLAALLLPAERTKTLTALANTEPIVGAQAAPAQRLQWFLSESTWDADAVNACRLTTLAALPATAADANGALVIDETGDRKDGTQTAHVGRQYLGSIGTIDNGVVSVGALWADQRVYYPLDVAPYTPAHWFARGKSDPAFRTKPQIALALVEQAVAAGIPFRAVVADCFSGEHDAFRLGLHTRNLGYVLALQPSHAWWHPIDTIGSLWEVADAAVWEDADHPGAWMPVTRTFRDGHAETWWGSWPGRMDPRERRAPWWRRPTRRPYRRCPPGSSSPICLPRPDHRQQLPHCPLPMWRRLSGCTGCVSGWNRVTNR